MTARKNAVAAIATQKVASTENYLEHAGEDIYGSYVFGDEAQRQYLPKPIYKKLRRTIEGREAFDPSIADAIAGRDVCGKAKTGSGKTLAFGVPLLQRTMASPANREYGACPTGAPGHGRSRESGTWARRPTTGPSCGPASATPSAGARSGPTPRNHTSQTAGEYRTSSGCRATPCQATTNSRPSPSHRAGLNRPARAFRRPRSRIPLPASRFS